ncbi:unnamed protein product, partial [Arctogadus glacialis]
EREIQRHLYIHRNREPHREREIQRHLCIHRNREPHREREIQRHLYIHRNRERTQTEGGGCWALLPITVRVSPVSPWGSSDHGVQAGGSVGVLRPWGAGRGLSDLGDPLLQSALFNDTFSNGWIDKRVVRGE